VKWDCICLPKDQGGLGVKNLALFKLTLLGKWKRRFLTESEAVWAELLRFRYGHLPAQLLNSNALSYNVKSSLWWRDIIGLEKGSNDKWFMSNIGRCVENGKNIGFWKFKWFGDQPFSLLFPDLFAKESYKEALISERMQGGGNVLAWSWNWSEQLTPSEAHQLEYLKELLLGFSLNSNSDDMWRWKSGTMGFFSVRSCYSLLLASRPVEEVDENILAAIKILWRNDVPSKVLVFGWRLLLDRLPTRSALNHRGILLNSFDLTCVFCSLNLEDSSHLFFSCQFVKRIWAAISSWIGKDIPTGEVGCNNFMWFGELVRLKKTGGRVNHLIWLAVTWNIWKHRNQVIFEGANPDLIAIVNDIKSMSWFWFSNQYGRKFRSTMLQWCLDHLGCINSNF
jgi:hypothetical protein